MVLVGRAPETADEISRLRSFESEGATLVAWQHPKIVQDRFPSEDVAKALDQASITYATTHQLLASPSVSPEELDFEIEEEVIRWFKRFGNEFFRERFRYGPLVLWWWSELYLYHETPLRIVIRDIELLHRLIEAHQPRKLVIVSPRHELETAARALHDDVELCGRTPQRITSGARTRMLHASDLLKMMATGVKSIFRRPPSVASGSPRVFFLTHGSMWRGGREMYFDRILPAVAENAATSVIAFGPPRPFKQRGLVDSAKDVLEIGEGALPYRPIRRYFTLRASLHLLGAFSESRRMWRQFRREAAPTHRGVALGEEAFGCFFDTFYRQHPWAIRSFHELTRALRAERPDVLVLYAESSGLGRAAIVAARELDIPSFAIQHGIMYPHYFSHEHASFELEGESDGQAVPIPTRTAVYGTAARDLLVERGSYDPDRIEVTGSPKFDDLLRAAEGYDAAAVRRSLGLGDDSRFVVLATRWTAVGPVFAELVEAIEQLDDIWLFVKPHQAEATSPYDAVIERLQPERTRMLPGHSNLLELLFASDGLVTVDSFASSEALVLGRPVLVVNLPSNLDALVEKGVALGVRGGEPILDAARRLLFDASVSEELERKRQDFIQEFAGGADGRATERIVAAILDTAGVSRESTTS